MSLWEGLKCGEKHDPSKMGTTSSLENPEGGLGFIEEACSSKIDRSSDAVTLEGSGLWRQLDKTSVVSKLYRAWNID